MAGLSSNVFVQEQYPSRDHYHVEENDIKLFCLATGNLVQELAYKY